MPFAPKIRKQILFALNDHIIPLLQTHTVAQVLAAPPFSFTGVESSIEQKVLLPDKKASPLNMTLSWEKERMGMRRLSLLGFGYSGASLERVGITRRMAGNLKARSLPVPPGITAFRLAAPGAIYVPSQVPHDGCSLPDGGAHRMLLLWFAERELWVTHHDSAAGGTHNLSVVDPAFQEMKQAYVRALEQRKFPAAQLLLLDLMRRLSDYLIKHAAVVSNSAWPMFEEKFILLAPHVSARNARYCYKVIDHIQLHLHTPLSLKTLAETCGVTVPHLCNVFRRSAGMTLMHYVTLHRLRAAEMMLISTGERIDDIAQLTGFANSHSFAGAFKRHFGMSAREYRQKNAER
jgi:AraC-like DNA-binding protein